MTKQQRLRVVVVVALFVFMQILGFMGYFLGFKGFSVIYTGWVTYLIVIGIVALVLMTAAVIVVFADPIFGWIQKGKDDESTKRAKVTDSTLHFDYSTPSSSSHLVDERRSADDISSAMSRKEVRESNLS